MLRKEMRKALAGAQRSFHSSAAVRKVVATNPVKAQEVPVCPIAPHNADAALSTRLYAVVVFGKVSPH